MSGIFFVHLLQSGLEILILYIIMTKEYIYLFIVSVLLFSCKHKNRAETAEPLFNIQTTEVLEDTIPNRRAFVGQTYSKSNYVIQPRISGFLIMKNFNNGMPVKKGQLLYKIDPAPFIAARAQASAQLMSSKAQLTEAESNYKRSVPLARINAISQSALDEATATLASARESVKAAEANLTTADLNLGYTSIYAPGNGIIAASNPSVGDYVGVGTQYTVLTTISDIDSISVLLSLPMKTYLQIVQQDSVVSASYENDNFLSNIRLTLSDDTVYPYSGIYKYTQPQVNNQTGTIVMEVYFPNPDKLLKPGQFARVSADIGKNRKAVLVPQQAVNEIQGNYNVYVVAKDSTVHFRNVEIGDIYGPYRIIACGLEKGDMVLLEGFSKVHNGMKIKPVLVRNEITEHTRTNVKGE